MERHTKQGQPCDTKHVTCDLSLLVGNYGGPGKAAVYFKWVTIWEMLATELGLPIQYLLSITSVAESWKHPLGTKGLNLIQAIIF